MYKVRRYVGFDQKKKDYSLEEKYSMSTFDFIESCLKASHAGSTAADCLAEAGTPSMSIAILKGGKVSSKCYSTLGDDEDTLFQACSISKPVTALAVMLLVDRGKLSVEDTIGARLPSDVLSILTEGCSPLKSKIVHSITIKQLLSHTGGLTVSGFIGYPPHDPIPTPRQVLAGEYPVNTGRVRLACLPGHSSQYSGGGFVVLQIILETVMEQDFASLMKELVLDPLDMKRSFFGALPAGEKNAARAHWTSQTAATTHHHINPELAAGGLWSTPTDLLKLIAAIQKSYAHDNGFLRKATARTMLTEIQANIGLGWGLPGNNIFWHTGSNIPGYKCIVVGYADLDGKACAPENAGLAIMTNSLEGEAPIFRVAFAAAYANGWPLSGSSGGPNIVPLIVDEDVGVAWREFIGGWHDAKGNETWSLINHNGRPYISSNGSDPIPLQPAARPPSKIGKGFTQFILEGFDMWIKLVQVEGGKQIKVVDGLSGNTKELSLTNC